MESASPLCARAKGCQNDCRLNFTMLAANLTVMHVTRKALIWPPSPQGPEGLPFLHLRLHTGQMAVQSVRQSFVLPDGMPLTADQ